MHLAFRYLLKFAVIEINDQVCQLYITNYRHLIERILLRIYNNFVLHEEFDKMYLYNLLINL